MLKHCLSLKTIIPNFVAFLVLSRIAIPCVRKMSFWVNSATGVHAGHCFIIHLPGGGQCPLVRDSEPIRLLEIPTSSNVYANCSYSPISTYIIVLTYNMIFPICFQQNLLILSKMSKIENPRWRPSAAVLDFLFCYHGNSG